MGCGEVFGISHDLDRSRVDLVTCWCVLGPLRVVSDVSCCVVGAAASVSCRVGDSPNKFKNEHAHALRYIFS